MSTQAIFPLCPWKHDPSGQPINYTMPLPVLSTETVISYPIVAVDDDDVELVEAPIAPITALTITNVTAAAVAGVWKVTFWAQGGTPGATYKLRCRWTLSDGRGSDTTVRLACLNT